MKKNKNWQILIVTTLGLLFFSPAMNLSNGLKTLFGYSRVSADTSNNSITIKPADFSKYFKLQKQDNTGTSVGTFTTVQEGKQQNMHIILQNRWWIQIMYRMDS